MRKKLLLNKFFALAILLAVLMLPMVALAEDPLLCPGTGKSVGGICLPDPPGDDPSTTEKEGVKTYESIGALVQEIIKVALLLVASIAVIFVIIGGYQYLTANGKEEQVKAAKATIIRALVGLIIVLFAYGIVVLVVKLVTNS